MQLLSPGNDKIYQYDVSTPYDLSTATFSSVSQTTTGNINNPGGISYNADGSEFYIVDVSAIITGWSSGKYIDAVINGDTSTVSQYDVITAVHVAEDEWFLYTDSS